METATEETYEVRRERERLEEVKRKHTVTELIYKALKILGFKVEKSKDSSWHHVSINAKKGDLSLHFSSGCYLLKDRIRISGNYPKTKKGDYIDPYDYKEKRHEITVAITRSAEEIAKEIDRRFLPRYKELLKRVTERVQKSNEYEEACARNLETIKAGKLTDVERAHHRWNLHLDPVYGHVEVSSDNAALELHSISIEVARKIIRVIRDNNNP